MKTDRVGVRELRQNLSVYLRRVQAGETLEVTERGRPVAILAPPPESASILDRLGAERRLIPASGELGELLPPPGEPSDRLSRALEEERAERLP